MALAAYSLRSLTVTYNSRNRSSMNATIENLKNTLLWMSPSSSPSPSSPPLACAASHWTPSVARHVFEVSVQVQIRAAALRVRRPSLRLLILRRGKCPGSRERLPRRHDCRNELFLSVFLALPRKAASLSSDAAPSPPFFSRVCSFCCLFFSSFLFGRRRGKRVRCLWRSEDESGGERVLARAASRSLPNKRGIYSKGAGGGASRRTHSEETRQEKTTLVSWENALGS